MKRPMIPRHEPEVVHSEADKRWSGDSEKAATTMLREVVWRGVQLSSRYDKAHEYDVMLDMVQAIPDDLVCVVEGIFCDSKATACYSVTLKHCSTKQARMIGQLLEQACIASDGGHNGIWINGATGRTLCLEPDWDIDETS